MRYSRRTTCVALALLAPALWFLTATGIWLSTEWRGLYLGERLTASGMAPIIVLGPYLAAAMLVLGTVRVSLGREGGGLKINLTAVWGKAQLAILVTALLMGIVFVGYFFVENFAWVHP